MNEPQFVWEFSQRVLVMECGCGIRANAEEAARDAYDREMDRW